MKKYINTAFTVLVLIALIVVPYFIGFLGEGLHLSMFNRTPQGMSFTIWVTGFVILFISCLVLWLLGTVVYIIHSVISGSGISDAIVEKVEHNREIKAKRVEKADMIGALSEPEYGDYDGALSLEEKGEER